ncbi:MAG: NAD-dependent epimerase/dehydratase family protein [Bacteroidales bacterium]|nr:NAD-dependent epimerase/dehydratase family protein [Bacteroidales bacterium]
MKEGKAKWYSLPEEIEEIFEYDIDSTPEQLDLWCGQCDFVFNLAGVNRPKDPKEFMEGNFGFATTLLDTLKKHGNKCPVMISSSIQATLTGRFAGCEYGKSKKAGEDLMFQYSEQTGAKVLVYRFPNLFGKWCRPNYNSAIATFCHNIANDLPIQVNDRSVQMELLYIDDLVDEMMAALAGKEHRCEYDSRYCCCPVTHETTLGEIVDIIYECADAATNKDGINMTSLPKGSLKYKLMSTFMSYLPKEKAIYDLKMNVDQRGSFTELLHTLDHGQVSINISKPGITKGQHWHHSKWETFIVVAGHGLIQLRDESRPDAPVLNFEVSGEKIQAVQMLPGYTHNIINLSQTEDLVTVMYCNERFSSERPDTYFDPVEK